MVDGRHEKKGRNREKELKEMLAAVR